MVRSQSSIGSSLANNGIPIGNNATALQREMSLHKRYQVIKNMMNSEKKHIMMNSDEEEEEE